MSGAAEQLLFFVVLGIAMWFLFIRPQRRRLQSLQQVRDGMHVGSAVVTTAGLHATVAAIEDDTVLLEIAPGVTARFAKQAVVRVLDDVTSGQPEEAVVAQPGGQPAS